ncbi:MAG TPA: HXXEE domain-containing protein [Bryobacteraceae bacterium]|nr:HXXEE domain-containing protein [Bryobacteraceae bacterium]
MTWTWFDLAWPWIGSIAAAILLILLFGTQVLRSDLSLTRWRDPVWLSWLAVPIYMLHNIEEYGIDLLGRTHQFPNALCSTLGIAPYPACPVPPPFYLAVNISLIWVAGPIAALLSRRHRLIGFVFYGVIIINGVTHVAPMVLGRGYNPGAITALVLFLPSFVWVARTCFGPGRISYKGLAVIVATGVIIHVVLIGSVLSFIRGAMGDTALVSIQILNAILFLLIPWTAERLLKMRRNDFLISGATSD